VEESKYCIIRLTKLKSFAEIQESLDHNFRTVQTPNADPSRFHLNVHSLPCPSATISTIDQLLDALPRKIRKNAVLVMEYLVNTSSRVWKNREAALAYFTDAKKFLETKHGIENVVLTTIHFDETTPHMAVFVVPIDRRGRLNASGFYAGRKSYANLVSEFYEGVGKTHGLVRGIPGSKATHVTMRRLYGMVGRPYQKVEVSAEHVMPRVVSKRANGTNVVESYAAVAARLTEQVFAASKELHLRANTAEFHIKRELEIRRTLDSMQHLLAVAERRAALAEEKHAEMSVLLDELSVEEKTMLIRRVERSRADERWRLVVGTTERKLSQSERRFLALVRPLCFSSQGDHTSVDWDAVHDRFRKLEEAITNSWTAVHTVLALSPACANTTQDMRTRVLEVAYQRDLQIAKIKLGQGELHAEDVTAPNSPQTVLPPFRPRPQA
jgi:hypothetical protein